MKEKVGVQQNGGLKNEVNILKCLINGTEIKGGCNKWFLINQSAILPVYQAATTPNPF